MRVRACPLCDSRDADTLFEPEAAEFCATNWSYREDYRALLRLPPQATFPIVRCRKCELVYAKLLPDDAFLAKLYDEVIREDDCVKGSENRESYARRLRYVAELIELAPEGTHRALDYGSGLGVTSRILRSCGVETVAYDPSSLRRGYSGEFADIDEVNRGEPYGMVVFDNVLEHLPNPVRVVMDVGAMTIPHGVAYVSVPSYEREMLDRQIAAHRRREALDMTLNPWEHLNYFDLQHLDALMGIGGFERIESAGRVAPPNVGLRAEDSRVARLKNAVASLPRIGRYAVTGDVLASTEHAFYRRRSED
jgi:SAM-dependent methyltransferase